jgi:hypothetical protein
MHLAGLAMLIAGAIFKDPFARLLRLTGMPLLLTVVFTVAVAPDAWLPGLTEWIGPAYMAGVMAVTFGYAYFVGSPAYF